MSSLILVKASCVLGAYLQVALVEFRQCRNKTVEFPRDVGDVEVDGQARVDFLQLVKEFVENAAPVRMCTTNGCPPS